jgi:hypothetical protein
MSTLIKFLSKCPHDLLISRFSVDVQDAITSLLTPTSDIAETLGRDSSPVTPKIIGNSSMTDYSRVSDVRSVNKRTGRPPIKICSPIEEVYATADGVSGGSFHEVTKIENGNLELWSTYECTECGTRYTKRCFCKDIASSAVCHSGSYTTIAGMLTWRLDMIPISPNPSESSPEVSDQELAIDEEPEASPRTGSFWEKSTSVFIESVDSLKSGRKLDEIQCECSSPCQTIMLRPNCRTVVSQYIYSRSYYLV